MELQLSTDRTGSGLRRIVLENGLLRVQILPEVGGKIWQITHKPTGTDLLWNNPSILPAMHSLHASYDDVWSGGWDELFPVDEEAVILGNPYPDHGELWTGTWEAEPFSGADEVGVTLRLQTPVSGIHIEKRIALRRGVERIFFHHKFANPGTSEFPFLWKLHPAFNVSEAHRIDFPKMRVIREAAFPGTLEQAPLEFDWPVAFTPTGPVDLRQIPASHRQQLYFFYGTEMQAGWCALTNTATGLACGLRFDPAIFPCCWLFASYGGWQGYNVAVLEPCTGYPLNFQALMSAGRQRVLGAGEVFETDVLFVVEPGHASIGEIDRHGSMIEASLLRKDS